MSVRQGRKAAGRKNKSPWVYQAIRGWRLRPRPMTGIQLAASPPGSAAKAAAPRHCAAPIGTHLAGTPTSTSTPTTTSTLTPATPATPTHLAQARAWHGDRLQLQRRLRLQLQRRLRLQLQRTWHRHALGMQTDFNFNADYDFNFNANYALAKRPRPPAGGHGLPDTVSSWRAKRR